jgi:iron complex transport system substrate-binding protein
VSARLAAEAAVVALTIVSVAAGVARLTPAPLNEPSLLTAATVRDASGADLPVGPRRCIASASTVSDRLVVALLGPSSLCAVATPAVCERPWCAPLAGKPRVASLDDPGAIAALGADLVVTANPGAPARLLRLREAGLPVFDLGPSTGLPALVEATERLGELLGRREAARAYAARFARRMASVASPSTERPTALYLGLYGSVLVGGARDTSWHDVLEAAGFRDAAADRTGWPSWTPLDVAERDPAWIVTETGMGARLCARDGIASTTACRLGHVAEVDADLLGDPGPTMLEAAEALADRIAELSAPR